MAVQNQRIATIQREPVEKPFIYISEKSVALASKRLNGNAFKVWLYLARHQDALDWEISPAAISEAWGIPISSVQKSITELKNEKYLVQKSGSNKNAYWFYEVSRLEEEANQVLQITNASYAGTRGFSF